MTRRNRNKGRKAKSGLSPLPGIESMGNAVISPTLNLTDTTVGVNELFNLNTLVAGDVPDGQTVKYNKCIFKYRMTFLGDPVAIARGEIGAKLFVVVAQNGATVSSALRSRGTIQAILDQSIDKPFGWVKVGQVSDIDHMGFVAIAGTSNYCAGFSKPHTINLTQWMNKIGRASENPADNSTEMPVVTLVAISHSDGTALGSLGINGHVERNYTIIDRKTPALAFRGN